MSIRENIQVFHPIPVIAYLDVLMDAYGLENHPQQPGAYLVDGLPFYQPQQSEEYVFVLGFSMLPLSQVLIQVLVEHGELASEQTLIRWTQEQDLVAEGTLNELGIWLAMLC